MRSWVVPLALAVALVPVLSGGCGSDASGVGSCKQIEEARCHAAASCKDIQLTPPYYSSGSAVDACVRFYDVACLHGMTASAPSPAAVSDCVKAIQTKGCAVVAAPWTDTSCAWLLPPEAGTEAEASTEAGEGGDASEGGEAAADGATD